MSDNTFGNLFAVTNFGEFHGPAIGCVIDSQNFENKILKACLRDWPAGQDE